MSSQKTTFKPFETRGRFYVETFEDGGEKHCQLVDGMCGMTVGMESVHQANLSATFARAYVKKHGDIDLGAFPFSMDTPLSYDSYYDERDWYLVNGVRVSGEEAVTYSSTL